MAKRPLDGSRMVKASHHRRKPRGRRPDGLLRGAPTGSKMAPYFLRQWGSSPAYKLKPIVATVA